MGAPKPTLGYGSRTEAVIALRREGMRPSAIARRLGIEVKTVAALECSARRSTSNPRADAGNRKNAVLITYDLRCHLREAARRRELSVEAVALRILETVAYSNLIDAVLDDADEVAR
ncbi:hypothetical protein [Aquamicrobium sp.]|uniref:hypothetical protein n=1 Tax=Aquamicrobium sp. TaxID=1872579 RepID=UPI0025852206|nr:hypothetical protein [Aquamicrobium sp.]MCK9551590.1 hypothetical protein [Aquamicrobium sp.]